MKYIVFIGRFQPPTIAHIQIMKRALEMADRLIVAIGSHEATISTRNPWCFGDRMDMISEEFDYDERITYIPIRDHMYDDNAWITELQYLVDMEMHSEGEGSLIGCFKDDTSSYLKFFPNWPLIEQDLSRTLEGEVISATDVRNSLFRLDILQHLKDYENGWDSVIGLSTFKFIQKYIEDHPDAWESLTQEHQYNMEYKAAWACAPFPPTFVTVDAVVIQSGFLLVVKRKMSPGKGLWALPGGFLGQEETIVQGMLRELKEETRINIPVRVLEKSIIKSHVFDHPQRSLRGRSITHAFLIQLDNSSPLPIVKGDDDAEMAKWMSFNDFHYQEGGFFEDHFHIINYFLNIGRFD